MHRKLQAYASTRRPVSEGSVQERQSLEDGCSASFRRCSVPWWELRFGIKASDPVLPTLGLGIRASASSSPKLTLRELKHLGTRVVRTLHVLGPRGTHSVQGTQGDLKLNCEGQGPLHQATLGDDRN